MPLGRPPKLTPALKTQIARCFWLAFTDQQTALMCGINEKTIRRMRSGGLCPEIKRAELEREAKYREKLWTSKTLPAGICFMLERKYPTQFAKPEIQLSFQSNYTQNNLSIHITSSEAKQIEAEAAPIRDSVKKMFAQYRPAQLENGNGNESSDIKG
jgi:hypothetical protein